MAHEMLMALNVTDDGLYREYRRAMMPILESYGGGFGYDFRVSEVLISTTDEPVNRVFTIRFPDRDVRERFFADEDYLRVRRQYFEGAVGATTVIAAYET